MRRAPILKYSGKKEYGFFFASDVHADDNDFDEKKFVEDLSRAVDRDQRILLGGDFFSLIMPKDFKRFTGSRAHGQIDAYVNNAVRKATALLMPFVNHIDAIGTGNHESSVVKFNGTDPIAFLVYELNKARSEDLAPIARLGYKGFLFLDIESIQRTNRIVVWYDHGRGGGAAVTKGMIDMNRTMAAVEGADILWHQHKHVRWADAGMGRYYPRRNGVPEVKKIIGMVTGCYQVPVADDGNYPDDYIIHFGEERMTAPQGTGGIAITAIPYTKGKGDHSIDYEISIRR